MVHGCRPAKGVLFCRLADRRRWLAVNRPSTGLQQQVADVSSNLLFAKGALAAVQTSSTPLTSHPVQQKVVFVESEGPGQPEAARD